jgi:hypothetical protein
MEGLLGLSGAVWSELGWTFASCIVGGTAASAIANKMQRQDVKASAVNGLIQGVVLALFACGTLLMIRNSQGALP